MIERKKKSLEERWDWIISFMTLQDRFVHEILLLLRKYALKEVGTMGVKISEGIPELVFNPEFVETLTDEELRGVITHEVYHLVLHHCTTRGTTDPTQKLLHNVAQDLAVNSIIENLTKTSERTLPDSAIFPRQFNFKDKLSYEQYLSLLKEKQKEFSAKVGSYSFDNHSGWDECPSLDEDIRTKVEELSRDQNVWGSLPSDVKDLILAAQKSQVIWTKYLRSYYGRLISCVKGKTLKRPNKRFGYPFPGNKKRHSDRKLLAIDTSCSIGKKDLEQALAEANRLAEIMPVDLVLFDADLQLGPIPFNRRQASFEFKGRGGTNFAPVMELASEKGYKSLFIITDGCADVVSYPEGVKDVLWVLVGQYNPPVPWGNIIRIYPEGTRQIPQDVSMPHA